MNRYKSAMDQLCFSEDVNDRIYISVISKNTNATERKINRLPIVCVLTGCVAIITIWLSGIVSLVWESEFISKEEIMEVENLETVREIQVLGDGKTYCINNVVIEPGEMVIFSTETDLLSGEESVLYGNLSGENLCYSVGYIHEGNYKELISNIRVSKVSETILSNETGKYYWCVLNVSNTVMIFDGNVQTETRHLIYKNFGEEVVVVDGACTFIINYHGEAIIEEIYVYNHQTQTENKVGHSTNTIYKVSVPGAYTVYAITKEGGVINLKDYLTIEYEAENSSGILEL
ncbi:MAG: hypothetical protein IKK33_03285 [Lachnospiraceae bacterium]|nr:hypothetical protein [Lachnospiraceae bacterium]